MSLLSRTLASIARPARSVVCNTSPAQPGHHLANSSRLLSSCVRTSTATCHQRTASAIISRQQQSSWLPAQLQTSQPLCNSRLMSTTAGDGELAKFLAAEIQFEEDYLPEIPQFEHFDTEVSGTMVVLTRKFRGEKVTVEFDINENDNVDESQGEDGDDVDDGANPIVSYPHFTVTVEKPSGRKLEFVCSCEAYQPEENEIVEKDKDYDILRLDNVCVLQKGESRAEGDVYESETTNMDETLYSHMLDELSERGVDVAFVNQLLSYSTAQENLMHVQFLKDLKGFVDGN